MTDLTPEASRFPGLPQRRPAGQDGSPSDPGLPQRRPAGQDASGFGASAPGLPQRRPAGAPGQDSALPRRTSAVRRVGRHRSLHRLSVASGAPALVIAVPGAGADADAELAEYIAEAAAKSCPGVDIRIGYLAGGTDRLSEVLAASDLGPADLDPAEDLRPDGHGPADLRPDGRRPADPAPAHPAPAHPAPGHPAPGAPASADPASGLGRDDAHAPRAVVVPLLAGPHPVFDAIIADAVGRAPAQVMLATALGPHPLLAGALHDRLSEVGLARASRARGLNIASGANGVIVVADRGPQAISDAGVTTVLLAARLAIPALPASFGDPASISEALQRLRDAGANHPAIAPCVIGPETDPAEIARLGDTLGAPCAAPLGAHPAVAQLVAVRYGEALARISVAAH